MTWQTHQLAPAEGRRVASEGRRDRGQAQFKCKVPEQDFAESGKAAPQQQKQIKILKLGHKMIERKCCRRLCHRRDLDTALETLSPIRLSLK